MSNYKSITRILQTIDKWLIAGLKTICIICLVMLLTLLAGNVLIRYFPVTAFYWFDEVVEWLFAWMVFFGAAVLWARNEHFKLDWIHEKLHGSAMGHLFTIVLEILSLLFLIVFCYQQN